MYIILYIYIQYIYLEKERERERVFSKLDSLRRNWIRKSDNPWQSLITNFILHTLRIDKLKRYFSNCSWERIPKKLNYVKCIQALQSVHHRILHPKPHSFTWCCYNNPLTFYTILGKLLVSLTCFPTIFPAGFETEAPLDIGRWPKVQRILPAHLATPMHANVKRQSRHHWISGNEPDKWWLSEWYKSIIHIMYIYIIIHLYSS